jgi:hypothetical protein
MEGSFASSGQSSSIFAALDKLTNVASSIERFAKAEEESKTCLFRADNAEIDPLSCKPSDLVPQAQTSTALRISELIQQQLHDAINNRHAELEGQVAQLMREKQQWLQQQQEISEGFIKIDRIVQATRKEMADLQKGMQAEANRAKDQQRHMEALMQRDLVVFCETQAKLDSKLNFLLEQSEADDRTRLALHETRQTIEVLSKELSAQRHEKDIMRVINVESSKETERLQALLKESQTRASTAEQEWLKASSEAEELRSVLISYEHKVALSPLSANHQEDEIRHLTSELANANRLLQDFAVHDANSIQETAALLRELLAE